MFVGSYNAGLKFKLCNFRTYIESALFYGMAGVQYLGWKKQANKQTNQKKKKNSLQTLRLVYLDLNLW